MKSALPFPPAAGYRKKIVSLLLPCLLFFIFIFSSGRSSGQINLTVDGVTGSLCFTAMDGNPSYDEDAIPGQVTLHSLTITPGFSISYNDPFSPCGGLGVPNDAAGAINIKVLNNFTMQSGASIFAENRVQSGRGGDISLTVGGAFLMQGNSLISSSNLSATSGDRSAGNITIDLTSGNGTFIVDADAEIRANSQKGNGGDIVITTNNNITINGHVYSKNFNFQGGSGTNQSHGGFISMSTPANIFVGDTGEIVSSGGDSGADLVHLCGCNITVYGLVESSGAGHGTPSDPPTHLVPPYRPDKPVNSTAGVEIWAGSSLVIYNILPHKGEVKADLCCSGGSGGQSWIDLFCSSGDITIIGKAEPDNLSVGNTNFAVHANGANGNSDNGGTVTIKALGGKVILDNLAVQADGTKDGGSVTVHAKGDLDLTDGVVTARGRSGSSTTFGGTIAVRSFSGDILTNAATTLLATGTSADGSITTSVCALKTNGFLLAGTTDPAAVNTVTLLCSESPSLDSQPYVVFCSTGGSLTIRKIFNNLNPLKNPGHDWRFTISPAIGGVDHFEITVAASLLPGGGTYTFNNVPAGTYTITEEIQFDPSCPNNTAYETSNTCKLQNDPGTVATVTVASDCGGAKTCTFINTPPNCAPNDPCQWCTKGAVLSQVWQNPGGMDPSRKCIVPDILVDVRMDRTIAANNVITPSEIGTGVPATWSIQLAVDYANAHRNDLPLATNPFRVDEIFIGVTATDPVPWVSGDINCPQTCGRPPSGDNPFGSENVVVNNLSSTRMNIFGCSVTMHAADPSLPVFTVQDGVGKVTILDLHVWNSNIAGYLVKPGNADLVTIKNSAAYFNDLGYDINDDNVQVSGSQHMRFNRIGALIRGSNNHDVLRTNSDITNNSEAGIKITGNNNETNNNEVGTKNFPNAVGIIVTGNNNTLDGDKVTYNTGNGIFITGDNNTIHDEEAHNNGLNGISAETVNGASGNKFNGNNADENGQQGIRACGQINNGSNDGEDNGADPQVDFNCPDPANAKFSVVDMSTDKAYKYDASFNLISGASLRAANADANDEATSGTSTYVLDKSDKQVYQYIGGTLASRVLKSSVGGNLSSPNGMAIAGNDLWVVDGSNKILYRYSLSAAFTGAGTINALQQINLHASNGNAEGLAIDATYLYVVDKSAKAFYRYPRAGGVGVASKVMKETGGGSLGNPAGAVLDGTDMWIVDNSKDKAYKYTMASLAFGVAGNVNAAAQYPLYAPNANATGISVGSSGNLLRNINVPAQAPITTVKDAVMEAFPNPSHDRVMVQFSSKNIVSFRLNIVDVTGRPVISFTDVTTDGIYTHEFDVSKLAKGTYLIVLEKENMARELKKIVVE